MHLSPNHLVAAYEYLRATPPFNKWRLPPSDDVEFRAVADGKNYGCYDYRFIGDKEQHKITVAPKKHRNFGIVLETMAHEMIHLHHRLSAYRERKPDCASHGRIFKRHADQVCKQHGFLRPRF